MLDRIKAAARWLFAPAHIDVCVLCELRAEACACRTPTPAGTRRIVP